MAKLLIASDLHTEFWGDASLDVLDPDGVDALIVAGDLGDSHTFATSLVRLCERFQPRPVLYVLGNHELYDASPTDARHAVAAVARHHANLVWLDKTVATVAGARIAGATLWFPHDPAADPHKRAMSDFFVIDDFEPWVYDENRAAVEFLAAIDADVVVTHHIPTQDQVIAKWRTSRLNRFFVGDADRALAARRPKVWVFGHTHDPFDKVQDGVRFVCNPRGYPGEGTPFVPHKIVEVAC